MTENMSAETKIVDAHQPPKSQIHCVMIFRKTLGQRMPGGNFLFRKKHKNNSFLTFIYHSCEPCEPSVNPAKKRKTVSALEDLVVETFWTREPSAASVNL